MKLKLIVSAVTDRGNTVCVGKNLCPQEGGGGVGGGGGYSHYVCDTQSHNLCIIYGIIACTGSRRVHTRGYYPCGPQEGGWRIN